MAVLVTSRVRNQVVIPEIKLGLTHMVLSEKTETNTLMVIHNPESRRPMRSLDATATPEILEVLARRTNQSRIIIRAATRCLLVDMRILALALATLINDKMTTPTRHKLTKDETILDKQTPETNMVTHDPHSLNHIRKLPTTTAMISVAAELA